MRSLNSSNERQAAVGNSILTNRPLVDWVRHIVFCKCDQIECIVLTKDSVTLISQNRIVVYIDGKNGLSTTTAGRVVSRNNIRTFRTNRIRHKHRATISFRVSVGQIVVKVESQTSQRIQIECLTLTKMLHINKVSGNRVNHTVANLGLLTLTTMVSILSPYINQLVRGTRILGNNDKTVGSNGVDSTLR